MENNLGQSEIRAHSQHLLLFPSPNHRQEGKYNWWWWLRALCNSEGVILQEDIPILNMHAPNNRASKSEKQNSGRAEGWNKQIHNYSANTPVLVIMEKTKRHKVSTDIIIIESLVCARLHAKHLYFIIWLAQQPMSRYYCHLQFTDEKTEAQRGYYKVTS